MVTETHLFNLDGSYGSRGKGRAVENTWAVEVYRPDSGGGAWVVIAADMTEDEATDFIVNRTYNKNRYRKRKLEGPAYENS